jgi:phosphoribosylformylglycinamidine synthase
VRACHDLSDGGLGVAAAEMAIAGGHGLALDLGAVPRTEGLDEATILFAETPSRFLIEVTPGDAAHLERLLARVPHARIGEVVAEQRFRISGDGGTLIDTTVESLRTAWQTPLVPS